MPESSRIFYDLGLLRRRGISLPVMHIWPWNMKRSVRLGLKDYERRTREAMERLELTEAENLKKFYFTRRS